MKESSFQLTEQKITKIDYKANKNFKFSGALNIEYDINVLSTLIEDGIGIVSLEVGVFNKKEFEEVPFVINISIDGEFAWDSSIKEDDLKILLEINAPAILLSYLRPFVSQITLFSGNPPLILPLINFTKE